MAYLNSVEVNLQCQEDTCMINYLAVTAFNYNVNVGEFRSRSKTSIVQAYLRYWPISAYYIVNRFFLGILNIFLSFQLKKHSRELFIPSFLVSSLAVFPSYNLYNIVVSFYLPSKVSGNPHHVG